MNVDSSSWPISPCAQALGVNDGMISGVSIYARGVQCLLTIPPRKRNLPSPSRPVEDYVMEWRRESQKGKECEECAVRWDGPVIHKSVHCTNHQCELIESLHMVLIYDYSCWTFLCDLEGSYRALSSSFSCP